MAEQRIETPSEQDFGELAAKLAHARDLVRQVAGRELSGGPSDLPAIQAVLDARVVEAEATYSLQALGIAFGSVFVADHEGYDWWMVEDEYGRDPAVRYRQTSLLLFPQTMISQRLEDGKEVDLAALYEGLEAHIEELMPDLGPD